MDEKFEYIEKLIEEREKVFLGGPYNLLIHSVLNTIELNTLIESYLFSCPTCAGSVESNINKRLALVSAPSKTYDFLYKFLSQANYSMRQSIRKMMMILLSRLESIYYQDFFNTFYHSKYVHEISSALDISGNIWDKAFNNLVLNDYLSSKKEIYLKAFLKNGDIKYILPHIKQIWSFEPNDFLKMELIRKTAKRNLPELSFIRSLEPEKYLYAISFSNKKIDDEEIMNCYKDIEDDLKPYALMSLGRLQKWDIIKSEITSAYIKQKD